MKLSLRLRSNPDERMAILLSAMMAFDMINWGLNALVNRFISVGVWWDSALVIGLLALIVMLAIQTLVNRQGTSTIVFTLGCLSMFIAPIILCLPGKAYAQKEIGSFFISCFPYYCVGRAIFRYDKLKRVLIPTARVCIISGLIWVSLYLMGSEKGWNNAMAISYKLLPFACLAIYDFFEQRSTIKLLWMLTGIMVIIAMGTRGSMLFLLLFVAVLILYFSSKKYKILGFLFLTCVGLVLYINYHAILEWMLQTFSFGGTTNAAFYKLLYAEDVSNGRFEIHEATWKIIMSSPILGNGIFAERELLSIYAHMLPLELCVDYGILIGVLILLVIGINACKCLYYVRKDHFCWCFLLIVIISGFFKLFLSGSYLDEPYFYLLLGILSRHKLFKKKQEVL